jgi:hypothetical protein
MKRSILKSIEVNALNWIFHENNIQENERSRLVPKLFEIPQTGKTYLLKPHIHSLEELELEVRSVIDNRDCVLTIVNYFAVQDDLMIPTDLKDALLYKKNIAFFIGAGVSKLLDIPLWNELADRAIIYMREKNYLNYSEALKLQNDKYQPKQIMSIFHSIINDRGEIETFYNENLKKTENGKDNPYEKLFNLEMALQKPIIKITTNIDREWETVLMEKADKQKIEKILAERQKDIGGQTKKYWFEYEKPQHSGFIRNQEINGSILYQIHGSLNKIDDAVITTSQYVKEYRDYNGLKGFLERVFKEYTVIFIGSSVQEFEILEHCLEHSSPSGHYSLIGTQIEEKNLFRIRKLYLSKIKIKAIPYYLDFQWYGRLLHVLDAWVKEIQDSKSRSFYDNVRLLDEVL